VVMKTLGLLRNLLSNKHHIDYITNIYGKQLMQAVVLILESEHTPDVKEQAVCILGNIADGDSAKKLIIDNEDMLRKLTTYMLHNDTKLQIAAVVCIQNLIWRNDEGSGERQLKLKEIGVFKILHQLLNTTDQALFEKVKSALQQLSLWQVYDGMTSAATEITNDTVKDDHDEDEINEDNSVTDSLTGELLDFMFF